MKLGFLAAPALGGVYTVFKELRQGLQARGMELRWIALGPQARAAQAGWEEEGACGEVVGAAEEQPLGQVRALIGHLEGEGYDGLMANVLMDLTSMNAVRYLPNRYLKVLLVHNMTPATYRAAEALRDHVHAVVGVSPRIQRDLVDRRGFSGQSTFCIPNGIDSILYAAGRRAGDPEKLRILSAGRIEDSSKGIFWLPKIAESLGGLNFEMTVAGGGPDLEKLKARFAQSQVPVTLLGPVKRPNLVALYSRHDAFLFPSRYEGLPLALLESMSAGCVPVASRISGVTDFVVEHGVSGLLFPVGDFQAAADQLRRLQEDRPALEAMSAAARESVRKKFSVQESCQDYERLILAARNTTPSQDPLPAERWEVPAELRPRLASYLPDSLKNVLRVLYERTRGGARS